MRSKPYRYLVERNHKGNSKYKGPEAGAFTEASRNRSEASVMELERVRVRLPGNYIREGMGLAYHSQDFGFYSEWGESQGRVWSRRGMQAHLGFNRIPLAA